MAKTKTHTRPKATVPSSALARQLADRLRQPADNLSEPFVVESPVAGSKAMHVLVIWDRWKGLDRPARSRVILEAYSTSGRTRGRSITVAMGLTQHEALRTGLLHYSLILTHRDGNPVSLRQLQEVYEVAGGVVETVGSSTVRRFPTRRAAEDAHRLVSKECPGSYWMVLHEIGTAGED